MSIWGRNNSAIGAHRISLFPLFYVYLVTIWQLDSLTVPGRTQFSLNLLGFGEFIILENRNLGEFRVKLWSILSVVAIVYNWLVRRSIEELNKMYSFFFCCYTSIPPFRLWEPQICLCLLTKQFEPASFVFDSLAGVVCRSHRLVCFLDALAHPFRRHVLPRG